MPSLRTSKAPEPVGMPSSVCSQGDLSPIYCPEPFNFQALLEASTLLEAQTISSYDNQGNASDKKNCAILALHDFELDSEHKFEVELPSPSYQARQRPADTPTRPFVPTFPPSAFSPKTASTTGGSSTSKPVNFSHLRRAKKRKRDAELVGQIPRKKTVEKFLKPAVALPSDLNLPTLPASAGAYSAKREEKSVRTKECYSLQELKDQGFEVICWDGRQDRPLTDQSGHIFGALVGIPQNGGYIEAVNSAYEFMLEEGRSATFLRQEVSHRRGAFPAINVGVTHGKGTLQPVVLDNKQHKPMARRLLEHPGIQRMAGFSSTSFGAWSPNVYQYYKGHLDELYEKRPSLTRNFPNSVFPTAAFNLGDRVCTCRHRDCLNCPFGMCSIQPVGRFDHTKGGHLVLWELKKAIEFPSGSLILIPSATITHSNIPVSEDETRLSFTQYAPGGLFRYVVYGLRTEKELKAQDPTLYQEICRLRPERWKMGLGLLSNIKDIQK